MSRFSTTNYTRALISVIFTFVFAVGFSYRSTASVDASLTAEPKPTPQRARKYSEFPHDTKAHRMECSSCHKFPSDNWKKARAAEVAFADVTEYPKHDSCIRCHTQQFFKGAQPQICSICHVNATPRNGARHPFPNPREIFDISARGKRAESDFVVSFPHDKHIEIVSAHKSPPVSFEKATFEGNKRAGEESCAVCHQTQMPQGKSEDEFVTPPPAKIGDAFWLKKGTFKSGPNGHTTCFTCHSADTGMLPAPQSCATCHQLKPPASAVDFDAKIAAPMKIDNKRMMYAWKRRDSSGTFRHEFFAHVELSCSTCHNVLTMKTADPKSTRVPVASCATCHATPTSDDGGALNYEADMRKASASFQCVKCHITLGKLPVPESHAKAIAAAAGK